MPAIHHRLRRAPLVAIAVAASVLAAAIAAAPAAHAGTSTTTCTGSSVITYQPGLTNTPRTVSYTETDTFAHCLSTDPTLASGLFTVTVSLPGAYCLGLPTLTTNTPYDIAWNNGQASDINLSYTDAVAEGIEQVTGVGTVTSGEFTGAAVKVTSSHARPGTVLPGLARPWRPRTAHDRSSKLKTTDLALAGPRWRTLTRDSQFTSSSLRPDGGASGSGWVMCPPS